MSDAMKVRDTDNNLEVYVALDVLEKQQAELTETARALYERLKPVMSPPHVEKKGEVLKDASERAPLADVIHRHSASTGNVQELLASAIDRLQV